MALNIRANGVGSWIQDPMTEKDTRCKEHFNPLGGQNVVWFLVADPKLGRFDTLMSCPSDAVVGATRSVTVLVGVAPAPAAAATACAADKRVRFSSDSIRAPAQLWPTRGFPIMPTASQTSLDSTCSRSCKPHLYCNLEAPV